MTSEGVNIAPDQADGFEHQEKNRARRARKANSRPQRERACSRQARSENSDGFEHQEKIPCLAEARARET
jgi:hypothetical protein